MPIDFVSLNSRLESDNEEEDLQGGEWFGSKASGVWGLGFKGFGCGG